MTQPRTKEDGNANRCLRKRRERAKKNGIGAQAPLRGGPIAGTGRPKGQKKT